MQTGVLRGLGTKINKFSLEITIYQDENYLYINKNMLMCYKIELKRDQKSATLTRQKFHLGHDTGLHSD